MNSIICGIISAFIVYLYMQKKDKKDKDKTEKKLSLSMWSKDVKQPLASPGSAN